jgi:hypothetical protein
MNALDDGSGNHFYFCQFANAASLPPEPLTSETSLSRERRKSSWIGSVGARNADFATRKSWGFATKTAALSFSAMPNKD